METVTFDPEQIEYVVSAIVYSAACICFCLGFNAWETSGK